MPRLRASLLEVPWPGRKGGGEEGVGGAALTEGGQHPQAHSGLLKAGVHLMSE